jgi:hypothetical protein
MSAIEKVSLPPQVEVLRTVSTSAPDPQYNVSVGYLRAFITVLVVAHHAAARLSPVCSSSAGFAGSAAPMVDGLSGGGQCAVERVWPAGWL